MPESLGPCTPGSPVFSQTVNQDPPDCETPVKSLKTQHPSCASLLSRTTTTTERRVSVLEASPAPSDPFDETSPACRGGSASHDTSPDCRSDRSPNFKLNGVLDQTPEIEAETDRTVITFGTYDLFHLGHLRILERAAEYGTRLVVGVSSDALTLKKKGKKPVFDEESRVALVDGLKCVDEVGGGGGTAEGMGRTACPVSPRPNN